MNLPARALVTVIALATLLIVAAPAPAQDQTWTVYPSATVPGWAVKMSLRIATRQWQICQHAGEASIVWLYKPDSIGEAGSAWPGTCRININTAEWTMHYVGPFCDTVVHEYGHVAGYTDPLNGVDPHHSRDPESIMAANGFYVLSNSRWTGVHAVCRPVERRAVREAHRAHTARTHR